MHDLLRHQQLRKKRCKGFLLSIFFCFFIASYLGAQDQKGSDAVVFSFKPSSEYKVIEKTNVSLYIDGSYKGHVYQENRGIYKASLNKENLYDIRGRIYHLSETTREGVKLARSLEEQESVNFILDGQGRMRIDNTSYPRLHSFPSFSKDPKKVGSRWESSLAMVEKAPEGGFRAALPQYCQYSFVGDGEWKGHQVYQIKGLYAGRYRSGHSYEADQFLKNMEGRHEISLLIDKESGAFLFMKDQFDQTYTYLNGQTRREKGFTLTFYTGITLMDKDQIVKQLGGDLLKDQEAQKVEVVKTDRGVALVLKDLHFVADKAILLEEDYPLLDSIATSLKQVPKRTFLVEGYTADIGSMTSQIDLSTQRAKHIVDQLVARGIKADRFLYTGLGGLNPIGDNKTEAGRKANRRVEITILED